MAQAQSVRQITARQPGKIYIQAAVFPDDQVC